jgi:hypothetical protein
MLVKVAHPCNFRYLGGRDWENPSCRSAQTKKFTRPQLNAKNKNKTGVPACHPSYVDDTK